MACHESASLGAYLLGALDPAEHAAMTRHLSGCRHCRAELLQMAPLPGLLRHTPFEEPSPTKPATSPGATSGTPATDNGGRRGMRRVLTACALAVAAAGTAIGLYLATSMPTAAPPTVAVTLSATNPSTHVAASATLTPEATGTTVRLTLTGLPPATVCHLVVHATDGESETAASWASGHTTTDTVPASTAISSPDITSLDVVTASGQLLVAITQS